MVLFVRDVNSWTYTQTNMEEIKLKLHFMSFFKIKTNILSIASMIVINDLIGFPLSASMANFLVFLVLCHSFSSVQVPSGCSPKFLAFSVPLLFPWWFIYSVTLSAVIFFWIFPFHSWVWNASGFSTNTLTLLENFAMRTQSLRKVLLTRKVPRDQMGVSVQFPHHHLSTDLFVKTACSPQVSMLPVMGVKQKLLDKFSPRLCF